MSCGTNRHCKYKIFNNFRLLCKVGNNYVFYHSGILYLQNIESKLYQKIPLPMPQYKKILSRSRLLERLIRLEPRLAIALDDEIFLLSYQGKIYQISTDGKVKVEHFYREGMNNPLSFCMVNNRILYGEYFQNHKKESVSIYERDINQNWIKKYTFQAGQVHHIHQIIYDQYRKCFWIATGDTDAESGIWKASLQFENVSRVFGGKQKYRSCFIMPFEDGIAYATDTPLDKNGIYYAKENKNGSFEVPYLIYRMPGPTIYGSYLKNGYVMATSVEPDSSLPVWRYLITRKRGYGVVDKFTHLIFGNFNREFSEIGYFEKDKYGMSLFQFGNVFFPNHMNSCKILCTGQSLKQIDGKTISIDLI